MLQTKHSLYVLSSIARPVHSIVELPDGLPTTLAIYNTEGQEFPIDATVQEINANDDGAAPLAVSSFSGQRPVYVEGNGAVKSFNFGPDVEEVEVLLTTQLRNMKAYVEILRGPNDDNEIINVETDNASVHRKCPRLCGVSLAHCPNFSSAPTRIIGNLKRSTPRSSARTDSTVSVIDYARPSCTLL